MAEEREGVALENIPDLVVFTEAFRDDGTPDVVLQRLRDMRQKEDIERMWREEHATTYLPFTEQARRMKLAAKLRNRTETKHAEIVRKGLQEVQKPIELDFEEMKVIKETGEPAEHGPTKDIWKVVKAPVY